MAAADQFRDQSGQGLIGGIVENIAGQSGFVGKTDQIAADRTEQRRVLAAIAGQYLAEGAVGAQLDKGIVEGARAEIDEDGFSVASNAFQLRQIDLTGQMVDDDPAMRTIVTQQPGPGHIVVFRTGQRVAIGPDNPTQYMPRIVVDRQRVLIQREAENSRRIIYAVVGGGRPVVRGGDIIGASAPDTVEIAGEVGTVFRHVAVKAIATAAAQIEEIAYPGFIARPFQPLGMGGNGENRVIVSPHQHGDATAIGQRQ